MEIRAATIKDTDTIIKLGNLINEFQVSNEVVTFWPKNVLIDCIKSKNNPLLVVEKNENIVGFILANYNSSFKKAIIENIYVNPDYRGREVGKLLLNNLLNELKKLGCEYVCSITESKNNAAVEFHLKNGFNKGMNCVWMDKILKNTFQK